MARKLASVRPARLAAILLSLIGPAEALRAFSTSATNSVSFAAVSLASIVSILRRDSSRLTMFCANGMIGSVSDLHCAINSIMRNSCSR